MHPVGYTSPERLEPPILSLHVDTPANMDSSPTEPLHVHDPRRPSALASRRLHSPPAVQTHPDDAPPPDTASDGPFDFARDAGQIFNNTTTAYDPTREVIDLTQDTLPPPPTPGEFGKKLRRAAPELLEVWKALERENGRVVRGLYEQWQREKGEVKKLVELSYQPWEESEVVRKQREQQGQGKRVGAFGWISEARDLPMPSRFMMGKRGGAGAAAAAPAVRQNQEWEQEEEQQPSLGTRDWDNRPGAPYTMPVQLPDSSYDSSQSNDLAARNAEVMSQERERAAQWSKHWEGKKKKEKKKNEEPQPHAAPTASRSTSSRNSALSDVAFETSVKLKLLPAIVLLSKTRGGTPLSPETVAAAHISVRSARSLARSRNKDPGVRPLMGLCDYYMGICLVAKSTLDGQDHRPDRFFVSAAAEARGVYPETGDAEDWLKGYREVVRESSDAGDKEEEEEEGSGGGGGKGEKRPAAGSAGSVIGSLIGSMFGRGKAAPAPREPAAASPPDSTPKSAGSGSGSVASPISPTADERPPTAQSSNIDGIWGEVRKLTTTVLGLDSKPAPLSHLRAATVDGIEPAARSPSEAELEVEPKRMARVGNGVPSFASEGSVRDEELGESPGSSDQLQPILGGLRVVNGTPSASTGLSSRPTLAKKTASAPAIGRAASYEPPPSAPSPKSHTKRKSIAFSAFEGLKDSLAAVGGVVGSPKEKTSPSPSPTQTSPTGMESASILARRMGRKLSSISSIATGREGLLPDELRSAEEGNSPFRSTFGSIEEGGVKLRKRSVEDMV